MFQPNGQTEMVLCHNSIARRCPQWQEKIRIIAAYTSHLSRSEQDSVNYFEQLYSAPHGAYKSGRPIINEGNLNLQIDVGKRGAHFAGLCFGLD